MEDLRCLLSDRRVQMVANCDIREDRRESVKSMIDAANGNRDCRMYGDAQELLARPDIEAVLIATSDRWHSLMSIWAAEAGKDIFCEKPLSLTIAESYALAETVPPLRPRVPGGLPEAERTQLRVGGRPGAERQTRPASDGARQHAGSPVPVGTRLVAGGTGAGLPEFSTGISGLVLAPGGRTTPGTQMAGAASFGIFTAAASSSGDRIPSTCASGPPTPTARRLWNTNRKATGSTRAMRAA